MSSNYPPGVSDRRYNRGVYKFSCADHGTSYGHGYCELGGFYLEDDTVFRCEDAEDAGDWVMVRAAQCETHGKWTELDVLVRDRDWYIETVWECPSKHFFITTEV